MMEHTSVSLEVPFYCSMRERCVLTEVTDTSIGLSDDFDGFHPNFLYPLGENVQFAKFWEQNPMVCDYFPEVNIIIGDNLITRAPSKIWGDQYGK